MKKTSVLIGILFACVCCQAQAFIEPLLQNEMSRRSDGERIRISILMQEQADQMKLRQEADFFADKQQRRNFVVETLKQQASTSQAELLHLLEEMQSNGMVDDIRPLWIVNAVSCNASKAAINDLARCHGIKSIGYEKASLWVQDSQSTPVVKSGERDIAEHLVQVNVPQVWDLGYKGQGVLVALIDTGVNDEHVDVASRLWDGGSAYPHHGYDFFSNDNNPRDENGHGSHCAGILCGDGTAGTQTGVAPEITLMNLKACGSGGETDAAIYCAAMQFAVEHGADIISISLSSYALPETQRELVRQTCTNTLEAGVVAAAAGGNFGHVPMYFPIPNNISLPAGCPPPRLHEDQEINPGGTSCVICVGAVQSNDELAPFSAHGPFTWSNVAAYGDYPYTEGSATEIGVIRPDVCAPGVQIKSLDFNSNDGYTLMDGTSMATPCVAGTIALMLSKNPNLTPEQIDEILENTAVKFSDHKDNNYGSGRIDALAAINAVDYDAIGETESRQVQVFPNPSADHFTVFCEGMEQVEVFSMDGKLVRSIPTNNTCSLQGLSNGVYMLQITRGQEKFTKKIVKY